MEPRLPIRVVVADDHHIWRSGLKADLGEGFEVVGEAEDASSAIEMIDLHTPDLALIDLHMPDGGGLRVVRERATSTAIVIITVSEAERDLLDAVAAGAVGYMVKSTRPEDLRAALRLAAAGEPVFSPQLAALVLSEFRRMARSGATALIDGSAVSDSGSGIERGPGRAGSLGDGGGTSLVGTTALTSREREVLGLVARGHSYGEVAEQLFISPKTVENHVRNILAKLHLTRRHELIRWAVDRGIT
ncbi:MAG: response regulator transcription factor [Microthrixaceae bacterium]